MTLKPTLPNLIEDLPFTPEEWDQTPAAVQEFVLNLLVTVQALTTENNELRERLNRHSGNSSLPPSSDGPDKQKPRSPQSAPPEPGQKWLRLGAACDHPKTAGTCRHILKREAALWTFVWVSGVEPTNNLAERQIRPGVIWRKGSFGTQSPAGSRFVERIMTVVATLRQQNRNVLDYVTVTCDAANRGLPAPSLLPSDTP